MLYRNSFLVFLMVLAIAIMGLGIIGCGDDDDDDDDDDTGNEDDDDVTDDDDDDTADDDDTTDDDDTGDDDDSGDDDDDATDPFDDFFPPEPGSLGTYRLWLGTETHWDVPAEVIGEDSTTFAGETFTKITFGDFSKADSTGLILWLELSTLRQAGLKGTEIYYGEDKVDWSLREVFDDPLYFMFDGDLNETQTTSASGDITFDDASSVTMDTTLDVTIVDEDATVDVAYGTVTGCTQIDMTITQSEDGDTPWDMDVSFYLHPDYALVKADIFPGFASVELLSPAE